jgi:2-methylisocitrate lyase-like PEP mutase family enzyme
MNRKERFYARKAFRDVHQEPIRITGEIDALTTRVAAETGSRALLNALDAYWLKHGGAK